MNTTWEVKQIKKEQRPYQLPPQIKLISQPLSGGFKSKSAKIGCKLVNPKQEDLLSNLPCSKVFHKLHKGPMYSPK